MTPERVVEAEASSLHAAELPPLGHGSGAVLLEDMAAIEVTVLIEMVVERACRAANFCRVLMSLNLAIAPSRRRNGWCEFSERLSLGNVTPADAYFGRAEAILNERRRIKDETIRQSRLLNQLQAA